MDKDLFLRIVCLDNVCQNLSNKSFGYSKAQPTCSLRHLDFEMGNAASGCRSTQYREFALREVMLCSVEVLYVS